LNRIDNIADNPDREDTKISVFILDGMEQDIRIMNYKGRLRNRVSQVNSFLITDKSQKPGFFGLDFTSLP
jgi:hypothetical protein